MQAVRISEPVKITVAGKINDPAFHKCVTAVRCLEKDHPDLVKGECLQFFETQWEEFMKKTAFTLKGVFYQHTGSHLIYLNDKEYVGNSDAFATWALHSFSYMDNSHSIIYDKIAADAYKKMINYSKTRKYA